MQLAAYHPFLSAQAQEEYLAFYDQRAKAWPVASETKLVDTFLGQTFVRISGSSDAPPLVLLSGSVFSSLMWIPNIEALSRQYRTYAVDNIYDSGRSIYTRAPKNPDDLVHWLDELFTALELGNRINLMGLSYGSWLTHQYALRFSQRLRKIVLLAHPAIVPMNVRFILRFLFCLISPGYLVDFGYWLLQDAAAKDASSRALVDAGLEEMRLAGRCFQPKRVITPQVVKDQELRELRVPALFAMGEHEKTFSTPKALSRLRRVAPHLQMVLIPQAGHDLSFAQAQLVNETVLAFLESI
jgi:pimeloyl-ACP methyl ester carboxylesterase